MYTCVFTFLAAEAASRKLASGTEGDVALLVRKHSSWSPGAGTDVSGKYRWNLSHLTTLVPKVSRALPSPSSEVRHSQSVLGLGRGSRASSDTEKVADKPVASVPGYEQSCVEVVLRTGSSFASVLRSWGEGNLSLHGVLLSIWQVAWLFAPNGVAWPALFAKPEFILGRSMQ